MPDIISWHCLLKESCISTCYCIITTFCFVAVCLIWQCLDHYSCLKLLSSGTLMEVWSKTGSASAVYTTLKILTAKTWQRDYASHNLLHCMDDQVVSLWVLKCCTQPEVSCGYCIGARGHLTQSRLVDMYY